MKELLKNLAMSQTVKKSPLNSNKLILQEIIKNFDHIVKDRNNTLPELYHAIDRASILLKKVADNVQA